MSETSGTAANDTTSTSSHGRLDNAKAAVSDGYSAVRERASEAYSGARERVSEVLDSSRERASDARARAADGLEANPFAAVIGGLALGALAAAILPRTEQEKRMLGSVGGRINEAAKGAVGAAREAARDRLAETGVSRDKAQDLVRKIIDEASAVAGSAATAAGASIRGK